MAQRQRILKRFRASEWRHQDSEDYMSPGEIKSWKRLGTSVWHHREREQLCRSVCLKAIHSRNWFILPYKATITPNMVCWAILFAKIKNHVICRTLSVIALVMRMCWHYALQSSCYYDGLEWVQVPPRIHCPCAIISPFSPLFFIFFFWLWVDPS